LDKLILFFLLFLGEISFFTFLNPQIFAEQFEPVNVSKSEGRSDLGQLSILGNNVYIVWRDNSTTNEDIYFAKGSDEGLGFEEQVNLSNNLGTSAFPRITVTEENIYATWYDYTPGQSDIFFAKSFDMGDSFETINLSDNGGVSFNPWIAAYEENIFVVWNDETPELKNLKIEKPENIDVALGTLDILLAQSHDAGLTFEVSNLSNSHENSWNSRISVYKNNVYVVWNEKIDSNDEIFLLASTDGGKSFGKPINISGTVTSSKDAGIRASGNNVYLIWREADAGTNIFFSMSENNGISFSNPIRISNIGGVAELTRDTQMVVSENNVYVAWVDKSSKNGVYFVRSDDNGRTFSTPINLSGEAPVIGMAQIAGFGEDLYVIWEDTRLGNSEVFLRKSNNKGQSFGSIINISNEKLESHLFVLGPQIAAMDKKVFAIYERLDEGRSDLFLQVINEQVENETLALQTLNGDVRVIIEIDKEKLEPGIPVSVDLKFVNPVTNELLENVNYSFTIEDKDSNTIVDRQNQQATNGYDTQTVTFQQTGPATIVIEIEGLEANQPDDKYAQSTGAVITVVPEFPIGIIGIMVMSIIGILFLTKSKIYQSLM